MSKMKVLLFVFVFLISVPFAQSKKPISTSINKEQNKIPKYKKEMNRERDRINLKLKAPSKINPVFPEGSAERNYEEKLNKEISQLVVLSKRLKSPKMRQSIVMRLAKGYSEKAALLERRSQEEYDKRIKQYFAGAINAKPTLDLKDPKKFNSKALKLYETYVREYPKATDLDEALFFLGYNNMSLGNLDKAVKYFLILSKKFPNSEYVNEANLTLGDYYFEKGKKRSARDYFKKVVKNPGSKIATLGLYKLAWVQHKLGEHQNALSSLIKVIKLSDSAGARDKRQISLGKEAKRDLAMFYAEAGNPKGALTYFTNLMPRDEARKHLEQLAYYYVDKGLRNEAQLLFTQLISLNPETDKSFDYQYSLVNMQSATGRDDLYEAELYKWVKNFGPKSKWAKAAPDKKKVKESIDKTELALRRYILSKHNDAREKKSKALMSRLEKGYEVYVNNFEDHENTPEMLFYYGELLYDLGDYKKAFQIYSKVPRSKYESKAQLNAVLSLEKIIPSDKEVRAKVGTATQKLPLNQYEEKFISLGNEYLKNKTLNDQKAEIKYRIASIYYSHNYFNESEKVFKEIIQEYPGTQYAKYSSDLILDSYKLKNDYAGLEKAGKEILSLGAVVGSESTNKVKNILEQSAFKKIEGLSKTENPEVVAAEFLKFVQEYPQSGYKDLAYYNAGINFEKVGKLKQALSAYSMVSQNAEEPNIYQNAYKFSVLIYDKLGFLMKAAQGYEVLAGLDGSSADEKKKYLINASIIRAAFNDPEGLERVFSKLKPYDSPSNVANYEYRLAMVYLRTGRKGEAIAKLNSFYKKNKGDKFFLVKAAREIADYYYEKRDFNSANTWYTNTKSMYQKYKNQGAEAGTSDAAYAEFRLTDKIFYDYLNVKIPGDQAKQQEAITKKLGMLDSINKLMTQVINYDDGYTIVSALNRLGQTYQHITYAILNSPLPPGLSKEELETVQKLLSNKVAPFKESAITSYKKALEKGRNLNTYNEDYLATLHELSKLDPAFEKYKVPYIGDETFLPYDLEAAQKHPKISEYDGKPENIVLDAAAEAISQNPESSSEVFFALAYYYNTLKFSKISELFLEKAGEKYAKKPEYFVLEGFNSILENNKRSALASFKKALDADANSVAAKINLAAAYSSYGGYEKAYNLLSAVYKSSFIPASYRKVVLNNFGTGLLEKGDVKNAVNALNAAVKQDAQYINAVGNLAIVSTVIKKDKVDSQQHLSQYKRLAKTQGDFDRIKTLESVQP